MTAAEAFRLTTTAPWSVLAIVAATCGTRRIRAAQGSSCSLAQRNGATYRVFWQADASLSRAPKIALFHQPPRIIFVAPNVCLDIDI